MDKVDCHEDLRHFSASAAAALGTGKQLAERQEQSLDAASQDLLCSPDIIRSLHSPTVRFGRESGQGMASQC